MSERQLPDGEVEALYDTDGDGRIDYAERRAADGVVTALVYDSNGDGEPDDVVRRAAIPADQMRDLVVILDSVPFGMVETLWRQGRFRSFHAPSRVIAPFPVMTDVSLSECFGVAPCPGVEAAYYTGWGLTNGYAKYAGEVNTPWVPFVTYRMAPVAHLPAYLDPIPWLGHELRNIQRGFEERARPLIVGYVVGTSAVGARQGRNGHQAALVQVDRMCQAILHDTRGRARITLFSDHGHNLAPSRRVPLSEMLRRLGYRVVKRLERPGDVVAPEFGMVTCAALHTRQAAAVARDCVGIEGVRLAAYRDGAAVVVVDREGRARIERVDGGFRYATAFGDPLRMNEVWRALERAGKVRADGSVADEELLAATWRHEYPDAVARLWRAFDGLVAHTPDVYLSIERGWHCGSATMTRFVRLAAVHGALDAASTLGFVMSTSGVLPEYVRMEDLRGALAGLGVVLPGGVGGAVTTSGAPDRGSG